MAITKDSSVARSEFAFFDATNLTDDAASHQHFLSYGFSIAATHIVRADAHRAEGKSQQDALILQRVKP